MNTALFPPLGAGLISSKWQSAVNRYSDEFLSEKQWFEYQMYMIDSADKTASEKFGRLIIEQKIRYFYDINRRGNENGNTMLHLASMHGNAELIGCLLALGSDPSIKNDLGKTAREVVCTEIISPTYKKEIKSKPYKHETAVVPHYSNQIIICQDPDFPPYKLIHELFAREAELPMD